VARFAICSAAYPTKPAFVAAFRAGIEDAVRGAAEVRLVLAVEHGFDVGMVLRDLPANAKPDCVPAPAGTTPAGMRRIMIETAAQVEADILVFADFDDRLLPDSLALHAAALEKAEISYGDLELIDAEGRPLGRRFFDGAEIPEAVEGPEALLDRNFMGFTNTAVRRGTISARACRLPGDLVAVDWWFFTMLLAEGYRARRTAGSVARYRIHADNTLGAAAAANVAALRQRAAMAKRHYAAIAESVDVRSRLRVVGKLLAALDRDPEGATAFLPGLRRRPSVWFDDVARAAAAAAGPGVGPGQQGHGLRR